MKKKWIAALLLGMASAGSKEDMGIDDSWKGIYAEYLEKEIVPMLDAREPGWKDG